jgi:hypothetical protein
LIERFFVGVVAFWFAVAVAFLVTEWLDAVVVWWALRRDRR